MVSCFISRIVILIFGTLYPAYSSYKAVRTKNVREYVKWMMYWIVFALFTSIETLTDLFLSFWFPFYYELKILTVIYLLSPATNGSSILYRKFVHPILARREQEIDEYIAKAKEQGYHTMLNLGSKGVTYATSLIMQTAIKGGGGLVSHLKKSYSLGDLSEDQAARQSRDCRDGFDYRHFENAPTMHFSQNEVPSRFPYGMQNQLPYVPDVIRLGDMPSHSVTDDEYFGPLSPNDVSSRYSSGDPSYYCGSPLVRTGSLGPSTRLRSRASAKTVLSKKGSLPEGVPARSLEEMTESQREPDERFLVPLTHSSSLPVSFTAINHPIKPDYQKFVGHLSPDQFLALFGSVKAESPQSHDGNGVETTTPEIPSNECEEASAKGEKVSSEKDAAETVEKDKSVEPKVATPKKTEKVKKSAGKPIKRPAPSPIKPNIVETAKEETEDFVTPSSSPKLSRKQSYTNLVEMIIDEKLNWDVVGKRDEGKAGSKLKVPEKASKKNSKKLQLPKMSFSFWSSKSKGNSSGSDNSSVASNENLPGATPSSEKTDLEYFVPLKSESTSDNHPLRPDEPFD